MAAPPSVVLQWRDELEQRFGLTFVVFDRDFVLDKGRERGFAVNPWTTHSRFILSHALQRDEAYAGPLRDWLGDFSAGSLLILASARKAVGATFQYQEHEATGPELSAPLWVKRLDGAAVPEGDWAAILESGREL